MSTLGVIGSGTSVSTIWGTNPAAGSKILVAVQYSDVSSDLSVSDNGTSPGVFSLDASATASLTAPPVYLYRADGITLPGAGNYAVTVTSSGTAHTVQAGGVAYSGAPAGGPSSTHANNATSSSVTTGTVTPGATGALFFAAFFDDTGSSTETITLTGSGFTQQFVQVNGSSYWAGAVADKIDAGGPTATACTWTLGDTPAYNAIIATYPASAPAGTSNVFLGVFP